MTSSPIGFFANDIPLWELSSRKEYEAITPINNNAYTFPYNNGYIVLYRNCVQGYLHEDYLMHRKHNWPDWETYKCAPTTDTVEKLVIKWVKGYPEALRERVPNTESTPRSNDRKDVAPSRYEPHENRTIPASLYSSWVFPNSEDSLVRDNWLSNLDQNINSFLLEAQSATTS